MSPLAWVAFAVWCGAVFGVLVYWWVKTRRETCLQQDEEIPVFPDPEDLPSFDTATPTPMRKCLVCGTEMILGREGLVWYCPKCDPHPKQG